MEHATVSQRKIYLDPNLQIIFCVTLMAVLGVSSITPAFPKIVEQLRISAQSVGLLITVFTFPGVLLTPVLGVIADRFGRKKILIPSLLLFGLAGGACIFARSLTLLLILRFFQGMGAASLGSLNITIIGDLYSGRERTEALGYNTSVLSVGTASYPTIGGALAMLGWYYPFVLFFIGVPVGFLVLFSLKNPEPKGEQNLREYLKNAWAGIKKLQVMGLFLASVVTFIILYGAYLTYFPLFVGSSFGASPLVIGLIMSTMSVSTALTSSQLRKLSKLCPEKSLFKIAFIIYALALVSIVFVHTLWVLLIPVALFGVAQGINIPSIQTLLARLAPMDYRGIFMSVNGMVLRLGQTLGPVLTGVVFGIWGMEGVFYAGASLALIMFIVAIVMVR